MIYVALNFMAEFFYGILIAIAGMFGIISLKWSFYSDLMYTVTAPIICLAEIFLFIALAWGLAGPVVSIVTSNGILVGIFHVIIYGVIPNIVQILGIGLTFIGVILLSSGDMILKWIKRNVLRRRQKIIEENEENKI